MNSSMVTVPLFVAILLFMCCLQYLVNEIVPNAYMDEVFHFPQTVKYCQGKFDEWDDKITTLPGLYVLGAFYAKVVNLLLGTLDGCSLVKLRYFNVGVGLLEGFLLYMLRKKLYEKDYCQAMMIWCFPVSFFFMFMYYTDQLSLVLVLAMYFAAKCESGWYKSSALMGGCAVFVRQTNIIWVLFVLGTEIVDDFEMKQDDANSRLDMLLLEFVKWMLRKKKHIVKLYWPFLVLIGIFGVFVKWNGGIVVGDRSNHVAVLHLAQLGYFSVMAVSGFGVEFVKGLGPQTIQAIRFATQSPMNAFKSMSSMCIVLYSIYRFSIVHPFILADNRHYIFYLWKNFMLRYPMFKYAMSIVYMHAIYAIMTKLLLKNSKLWIVVYSLATSLALVASPLVEFRYFLVPFALLHLHSPPMQRTNILFVIFTYTLVNIITMYIFLFRPRKDTSGLPTLRIMW